MRRDLKNYLQSIASFLLWVRSFCIYNDSAPILWLLQVFTLKWTCLCCKLKSCQSVINETYSCGQKRDHSLQQSCTRWDSGAKTAQIKSENSLTSSNIEFKKQTLSRPVFLQLSHPDHTNKGMDLQLKKGEGRCSWRSAPELGVLK